jgi:hypothetical protein
MKVQESRSMKKPVPHKGKDQQSEFQHTTGSE